MIKIAVVVILVAIIAISAVGIVDNNYSIDYGGYNPFSSSPFLTLTANITHPSPQANFTYGYASPNLWGFAHGGGNTMMEFYRNSSIHIIVNFINDGLGIAAFGYSSEHFTHNLPMPLSVVYKDNLSSYVSFNVVSKNSGTANDLAYDMFLGQSGQLQYEVMIMLGVNTGATDNGYANGPFSMLQSVLIPTKVNNNIQDVNWIVSTGSESSSGAFPVYVFTPSIVVQNKMSYTIDFTPFLSYLQNNSYIPYNVSIVRLGIGSEFAVSGSVSSVYNTPEYNFWLYSYFVLNGTKYQIIQPSGGI